jgi:hypothetical protein
VGHVGEPLRGAFSRIAEDGRELKFRYVLRDGARERRILSRIRDGHIRHCSVGLSNAQFRFDRLVEVTHTVDLIEISLLDEGDRPAWYGTSVEIERVF